MVSHLVWEDARVRYVHVHGRKHESRAAISRRRMCSFHLLQSIGSVEQDVPSVLSPSTSTSSHASSFVPPPLFCLASASLLRRGMVHHLASLSRSMSVRLFGPGWGKATSPHADPPLFLVR
uniref:Uncharacterized protein n=1 Tax=Picocystis salinarum TaxID=88271 RepID=A0A7S3XFY6_9CHLO